MLLCCLTLRLVERNRLAVDEMKGGIRSHKQGMAEGTPQYQGHKRRDERLGEAQRDGVDQVSQKTVKQPGL